MALACVARRRKGRRKRNWDDVYVRDLDGTLRKPNALERRLVRRQCPYQASSFALATPSVQSVAVRSDQELAVFRSKGAQGWIRAQPSKTRDCAILRPKASKGTCLQFSTNTRLSSLDVRLATPPAQKHAGCDKASSFATFLSPNTIACRAR